MQVKICGLRDAASVEAAVSGGARYIGFMFVEKSPRYVTVAEATDLATDIPPGICKVAVTVDADDATLDAITSAPIDMLQLHGEETPERVAAIRTRYGLPVMKVLSVAEAADLDPITAFAPVSDQILLDAKAPKGSEIVGGNGLAFDWRLIEGRRWPLPWMLAGGLTPENVGEAIRRTGATQLDVSSGVESARGVKDPALIAAFLKAALPS